MTAAAKPGMDYLGIPFYLTCWLLIFPLFSIQVSSLHERCLVTLGRFCTLVCNVGRLVTSFAWVFGQLFMLGLGDQLSYQIGCFVTFLCWVLCYLIMLGVDPFLSSSEQSFGSLVTDFLSDAKGMLSLLDGAREALKNKSKTEILNTKFND